MLYIYEIVLLPYVRISMDILNSGLEIELKKRPMYRYTLCIVYPQSRVFEKYFLRL